MLCPCRCMRRGENHKALRSTAGWGSGGTKQRYKLANLALGDRAKMGHDMTTPRKEVGDDEPVGTCQYRDDHQSPPTTAWSPETGGGAG